MTSKITGTQAYNYLLCPHRVYLDASGDPSLRDESSAFIDLLWEHGVTHEAETVCQLDVTCDLSKLPRHEKTAATTAAMQAHEPLIYQGRIECGDRVGEPDLLEWTGCGYRPGDIKSGSAFEDGETEKIKKTYAVQTAHYTSILNECGFSDKSDSAFIVDRDRQRQEFRLDTPMGVKKPDTWMDLYLGTLADLRNLAGGVLKTRPALSATCKLCHWRTVCRKDILAVDDLTLIPELGRALRDKLSCRYPTVRSLALADVEKAMLKKGTIFFGIGQDTLRKFHARAVLLSTPGATPYLKRPVALPVRKLEVFLDIEADPLRDNGYVYLHGLIERQHGQQGTSRFLPATVRDVTQEAEEEAFRQAINYLRDRINANDAVIYYYAPYERTAYKALAKRYPSVITPEIVEAMFACPTVIDLYTNVVRPATEWPVHDHSIKTIAKYLGFKWRDTNPSGAESIQWFNEWAKTRTPALLQRVLDYNEDDCKATMVVVDAVRQLPLASLV